MVGWGVLVLVGWGVLVGWVSGWCQGPRPQSWECKQSAGIATCPVSACPRLTHLPATTFVGKQTHSETHTHANTEKLDMNTDQHKCRSTGKRENLWKRK